MKVGRLLMVLNIVVAMLLLNAVRTLAQTSAAPLGSGPQQQQLGALPLQSNFYYQGQLSGDGIAINDTCDFRFSLYNTHPAGTGVRIGDSVDKADVPIVNGAYAVELDFGDNPFDGYTRALEVAIKCPSDDTFVVFGERQPLLATPYASNLRSSAILDKPTAKRLTIEGALRVNTSLVGAPDSFVFIVQVPYSLATSVYIDNPLTNNDPDAMLFVTQRTVTRYFGSTPEEYSPFGVQYDDSANKWEIYLLNTGDGYRRLSESYFNVLVVKRCDPLKPLVVGCNL